MVCGFCKLLLCSSLKKACRGNGGCEGWCGCFHGIEILMTNNHFPLFLFLFLLKMSPAFKNAHSHGTEAIQSVIDGFDQSCDLFRGPHWSHVIFHTEAVVQGKCTLEALEYQCHAAFTAWFYGVACSARVMTRSPVQSVIYIKSTRGTAGSLQITPALCGPLKRGVSGVSMTLGLQCN